MRKSGLALILCAAPAFAGGETGDYAEFRSCVEAVETAAVTATFHHCTGKLVAACGASKTASEASACILAERDKIEAEITKTTAALAARRGESAAEIDDALLGNRSSGEASCAMMTNQDASSGVKVGQRAVNGAFCQLIVSGDVLGMLYRMETAE